MLINVNNNNNNKKIIIKYRKMLIIRKPSFIFLKIYLFSSAPITQPVECKKSYLRLPGSSPHEPKISSCFSVFLLH